MAKHKTRNRPFFSSLVRPSGQELRLLIVWIHSFHRYYRKLFRVILREICGYIAASAVGLPSMNNEKLILFDAVSETWMSYRLNCKLKQKEFMTLVVIDNDRIACCGGLKNKTHCLAYYPSVYLLYTTGMVLRVCNMKEPRARPGVVYYKKSLLIFGGVNDTGSRTSCEELSACSNSLPSMQYARFPVTHCLWRQEVYIAGAPFHLGIEVYSPKSRLFRLLAINIGESEGVVSYVKDGNLVFAQREKSFTLSYSNRKLAGERSTGRGIISLENRAVYWQGKVYAANGYLVKAVDSTNFSRIGLFEFAIRQ